MDYFYAQVDEKGVCVGVSRLAGEVGAPGMLRIDAYDVSLLGRRWDAETGEWAAGACADGETGADE